MDDLGEEIEWRSSASIGQPCSFITEPVKLHYQGISPMDPLISQLIYTFLLAQCSDTNFLLEPIARKGGP